jgi:hypothetical protein
MMQESAKDRAAREVVELKVSFEMALSSKRKYPAEEFCAFVQSVRRYIELTKHDAVMHKSVAEAVHGLREFIQVERRRIPQDVVFEADRLECQLFAGYDPGFEGEEPPGL